MDKKWILTILLIILIFMVGGIFIFSNQDEEKSEVTNSENKEEILSNDIEEQEENYNEVSAPTLNEQKNNVTEKKIVNQVSPSGFMGSSLYRVVLYSNGEVYVEKFDGNGYEETNCISNDLIAKDAESIEEAKDEEHYGEVFIKGGELINSSFGWISVLE